MTTYTLETKDPLFSGSTQKAEVLVSWSRGTMQKVRLEPSGMIVILVHPWLANAGDRIFQNAWEYAEKYGAENVVVGELKETGK